MTGNRKSEKSGELMDETDSLNAPEVEEFSELDSSEDPMEIFFHGTSSGREKREPMAGAKKVQPPTVESKMGTLDNLVFVPLRYFLLAILTAIVLGGVIAFLFLW